MSIKNAKPSKKSRYKQGYYNLKNPQKYKGDPTKIVYRSSWELRFMIYCDENSNVLEWSSEPFSIPYYNPIEKKTQNYYIDFFIKIKDDQEIKNIIVEVKPKSKVPAEYGGKRPILEGERMTLKKAKAYNRSLKDYIVNKVKFDSARRFAREKGWDFKIVTEEYLFKIK